MKPLQPLASTSSVESLLRGGPPEQVRAELERLDQRGLVGLDGVARRFADGALALREGRLDDAFAALDEAASRFEQAGETEAAGLARCEAWLARIRRGPRSVYGDAAEALEQIAAAPEATRVVRVVALHYQGTALRYSGRAEATLRVLLDAFAASDELLIERAQVLNSLGTLYVVLGAYGAAQAVLEHAAELNHQIGDRVSEAISYGQLGSAALALGELEAARRHLQKQEWFASRVGDAFGQARALTFLGDLAIDLGRPDDALLLAEQARTVASAVQPPLGMWVAYATRTIGRAKVELGDASAVADLEAARDRFRRIGNQLGEALVQWDLAHQSALGMAGEELDRQATGRWFHTAWSLATLGLTGRVAQVLRDLRSLARPGELRRSADMAVAAAAQSIAHLSAAHEVELVYAEPDTLADIATRRIEGQRNLGRMAALTLAGRGLIIAALASRGVGIERHAMPSPRAAATLIGQLPGIALWAWPTSSSEVEVARDLSSFRAALGESARAVVDRFAEATIVATPFAGELGAKLAGADTTAITAAALAAAPGTLLRGASVPWNGEAEALARMGGYEESSERPA